LHGKKIRVSSVFNPWLKKPSPPTRPTRAALAKPLRAAESARGLPQSKTLRAIRKSPANALRFGLRQPSAAFLRRVLDI